ncbi:MAG TPA: hypothetical protein VMS17_32320 [Gemmataceae bacterium]|nr:hypothetical protein [Gemmataceae bacterium]
MVRLPGAALDYPRFGDGEREVVEVCTGRLTLDQFDAEVLAVVDDLCAFGYEKVHVTCGFGCNGDSLSQWREVPLPAAGLADYVAELERRGVYELGETDLFVSAAGVEFRLCHEGDIHCAARADCPLLCSVRRRWRRAYYHSWERRHNGRWRRLAATRHGPA